MSPTLSQIRHLSIIAALLAGSMALSACGFTPLYASPVIGQSLTSIEVEPTEGRLGFLIREALNDSLGTSAGNTTAYRLGIKLETSRAARGLSVDSVASRYEFTVKVKYQLIQKATGQPVTQGAVISEVTYDSSNQPYAGMASQQDAEERAAIEIGRKIQLNLATWFNQHP